MRRFLNYPLTPLLLFSIALTAFFLTCLAVGLAPTPTFDLIASFFWSILLAFWIVADARRRTGVPCFDFGLYCYLFLPVAVPWYCIWSRGLRGLLMLISIALLWLAPYIVANVAWLALYG